MPIVTKFPARFVAACRIQSGGNNQQRKLSSAAPHACASIDPRPPRSTNRRTLMKQPSVYLKMRVLGAIDTVQGRTRHERVHNVAALTFLDEEGTPPQFTGAEAPRPLRPRPGTRPLPVPLRTPGRTLLRRGRPQSQKRQHLQL